MQPPTAREARLETLLSDREVQLSELHDEITRLQKYIPSQPATSTAAPLALPPAISSILIAQLSENNTASASSSSSTVVAALTQRAQLLQEENDELYELLRYSETGKLKEEVRGLRRLVQRLQNALRQSHDTIDVLSRELDKSYEAYLSAAQSAPSPQPSPRTYPSSPRMNYTTSTSGSGSHSSKLPPTGPRAQKRPRLSEPNTSFNQSYSGKPHSTAAYNHYPHTSQKRGVDGHPKRSDKDGRVNSDANKGNWASKMDVDKERPSPSEQIRGRDKDTDREHDRSRDRDRERNRARDRDRGPKDLDHNRDRDRVSGANNAIRRNGAPPGRANGRRGDRTGGNPTFHGANTATSNTTHSVNGDRTLAERMGL